MEIKFLILFVSVAFISAANINESEEVEIESLEDDESEPDQSHASGNLIEKMIPSSYAPMGYVYTPEVYPPESSIHAYNALRGLAAWNGVPAAAAEPPGVRLAKILRYPALAVAPAPATHVYQGGYVAYPPRFPYQLGYPPHVAPPVPVVYHPHLAPPTPVAYLPHLVPAAAVAYPSHLAPPVAYQPVVAATPASSSPVYYPNVINNYGYGYAPLQLNPLEKSPVLTAYKPALASISPATAVYTTKQAALDEANSLYLPVDKQAVKLAPRNNMAALASPFVNVRGATLLQSAYGAPAVAAAKSPVATVAGGYRGYGEYVSHGAYGYGQVLVKSPGGWYYYQ